MAYFEWCERYEMGVEVIDYQHKRLVQLINDLYETNQDRSFKEGLMEIILDELARYTIYHFAKEEELMEKVSFINMKEHKILHQNFVKKLENFKMQYSHKDDIRSELFEFLKGWLENHILHEDQQIAQYMSHREGLV